MPNTVLLNKYCVIKYSKKKLNYSSFLAVLYLKIGIIVGMVCLCITGILVAVCCYKKKQRVVKDAELEYTRLAE